MVTPFPLSLSCLGAAGSVIFDFRGILRLLQGFCLLDLFTFNCTSLGHSICLHIFYCLCPFILRKKSIL